MKRKYYKALTISERIKILKEAGINLETDKAFLDRWTNIKGLTSIADTKILCDLKGITLEEFTYAIKPFDVIEEELLEDSVEKSDWYLEFSEIMDFFKADDVRLEQLHENMCYAIRPFLKYFVFRISNFINENKVKITEHCMNGIFNWASTILSSISTKIITLDMHLTKEKNPDISYKDYLSKYDTPEKLEAFYAKYPVMTRLLTERTRMMMKNTDSVFKAVLENETALTGAFRVSELVFDEIAFGEGDTHSRGKSVSVIQFADGKKVIFKPKFLKIEKYFNDFVEYINEIKDDTLLDLKTCRSIWKDDYTLSEFINTDACENKEEVSRYYERVGHILFLMHIMNGTDFHYENIISSKGYPYLIDIETLFQIANYDIIPTDDIPELEIIRDSVKSVLSVGILPLLGFTQNPEGKSIDISALNGKGQRLPFKVLQLKNANTTEMVFEYDYTEIKDAGNIPFIGVERQSFAEYSDSFVKGFKNMARFVLNNKKKIMFKINEIFRTEPLFVRQLTKATANYATLMSYSNHPNYLSDMVYMERLYENLMSYPYSDKRIVCAEIEDMLNGDIPIFFSQLDSREIYTSELQPISDYFCKSPLDFVLDKIDAIDETEVEKQMDLLLSSIGNKKKNRIEWINNVSKEKIDDAVINSDSVKTLLIELTNWILDKRVFNKRHNQFTWTKYNDSVMQKEPIDFSYGNGLSGLAQYFEMVSEILDIEELSEIYGTLIKKIDELPLKYFETNFDNLDTLSCYENAEGYVEKYTEFLIGLGRRCLNGNIQFNEKQLLTYVVLAGEYIRKTSSQELSETVDMLVKNKEDIFKSLTIEEKLFCRRLFVNEDLEKAKQYADEIMSVSPYERWKICGIDCYSDGVLYIVNNLIDIYNLCKDERYLKYVQKLMSIVYRFYQKHGSFRIMSDMNDCNVALFNGIAGISYTFARAFVNMELPNIFCLQA